MLAARRNVSCDISFCARECGEMTPDPDPQSVHLGGVDVTSLSHPHDMHSKYFFSPSMFRSTKRRSLCASKFAVNCFLLDVSARRRRCAAWLKSRLPGAVNPWFVFYERGERALAAERGARTPALARSPLPLLREWSVIESVMSSERRRVKAS